MLKVEKPLVSVQWLYENLNDENLIIFDATIPKVTSKTTNSKEKNQIPNAVFFDLKNVFLDKEAKFPNTFPDTTYFEKKAQEIGVNQSSCILVYDDLGIYSSARVWWLFTTFGFTNVAVLDGGLPEWEKQNYPVELQIKRRISKGNFRANFNEKKIVQTKEVLLKVNDENFCIADARSKARFYAEVEEPRKEVKRGHIPNSYSLPYSELQADGKMKSKEELRKIFDNINSTNKTFIFSCGTGITACILALGLAITAQENYTIYDGSWTEWGSTPNLPIEK